MTTLQAIKYEPGKLEVLDQLRLPHEFVYDNISTCEEAFDCIKSMRVRGAPAIAIVAALALAVEVTHKPLDGETVDGQVRFINQRLDYLKGSRPTAVDLANAIRGLKSAAAGAAATFNRNHIVANLPAPQYTPNGVSLVRQAYIAAAEKILADDLSTNLAIGKFGAEYLGKLGKLQLPVSNGDSDAHSEDYFTATPPKQGEQIVRIYRKMSVLTHCNTGSLATSGHGTALGIIRSLHEMEYLDHAYCTETRPYNQGSRLTAFELAYEKIPATLITDSMAGALFDQFREKRNITAVIVGADRVARNGDTANKIGTYSLAVLAHHHDIKFIVAAPTTSIDLDTMTGSDISIENRAKHELTQISGAVVSKDGKVNLGHTERVAIAHQDIDVWNPGFDVTPAKLIDAIITEKGAVIRGSNGSFDFSHVMPERWNLAVRERDFGSPKSDESTQFKMEHL